MLPSQRDELFRRARTIADRIDTLYEMVHSAGEERKRVLRELRELGVTDTEISERLGISRVRVWQLTKKPPRSAKTVG